MKGSMRGLERKKENRLVLEEGESFNRYGVAMHADVERRKEEEKRQYLSISHTSYGRFWLLFYKGERDLWWIL